MQKTPGLLFCILFILGLTVRLPAEDPIPDDPYNILKDIPSFYELFAQKGLSAYSADVKIEGAITKTLLDLTTEKNLPPPEFLEYYTAKNGFAFRLRNAGYPPLLKQIICEMFTPVQIFDRVISLIESKRELAWFQHFKSVTRVEAKWIQYQDGPHIKLVFTADPANPIEKRDEPDAAGMKTVITNVMTFIIQPSTKMIKVLKVDQTEKSLAGETKTEKKFLFQYKKIGAHWMPSELTIEKNGKEEVKLHAVYVVSQNYIVYAEKSFGYFNPSGKPETVKMTYGNYRFNNNVDLAYLDNDQRKGSSLSKEAEAEKLFNKAKDLIVNGKTRESRSLLKKIIKDYPESSYADQSKTLLDGLPE